MTIKPSILEKERILVVVDFPERVTHGGIGKLQLQKTGKNVLDFSASVNPFPPHFTWNCDPKLLEYYPDDTYSILKERIGSVYGRDPSEICVGNGSVEIIRAFCNVTLGRKGPGRRFFLEPPTFGEYELSARLAGAERTADPKDADVWFFCNPNNPTGTLHPKTGVLEMMGRIQPHGGILFCDEAFIALSDPEQSVADIRDPSLFVLHSLTKSFAVPGLRIGFGFGDANLVRQIETARSPWSVNAYAEAFTFEALLHLDELAESRAAIAKARDKLAAGLKNLGFSCHPTSTNYILADYSGNVRKLCEDLAAKNILIRDCTSFGLPTCIRVAVRTDDENRQLLEALSRCVR